MIDAELSAPVRDVVDLSCYRAVRVLVRVHGYPVGAMEFPARGGKCTGAAIRDEAFRRFPDEILHRLVVNELIRNSKPSLASLGTPPPPSGANAAEVTVGVCTRNRVTNLAACLDALERLTPAPAEVIVVDNAPSDDSTRRLVESRASVRYVREPVPGLDRARNRAIAEARTEIIAFTDDDVVVDSRWAGAIAEAFRDDPTVMAVTGLVEPLEIDTEAQELFERYGGFGRGFQRRWYSADVAAGESAAAAHGGAGKFGTGANMAFRRSVFARIGDFDPALDVGTVTNGGGDLDMLFRVVRAGYTLAYEPAALVWHRHRRTYGELREQLTNNGIGFYSYLVRNAIHDRTERRHFLYLAAWWFKYWNLRRLALSYLKPGKFPRDLIVAELRGSLAGLRRYQRSAAHARQLASGVLVHKEASNRPVSGVAKRCTDVKSASGSRSRRRLAEVLAKELGVALVADSERRRRSVTRAVALRSVRRRFGADPMRRRPPLSPDMSVAIVIPTYDRPQLLAQCLESLTAQRSARSLDIIVVDNHPVSGMTPSVVARYPGVRLVTEARQGLSYARNAGIRAASARIVIATDDDVTAPPQWVETLVAPFADPQTMVVTGNVVAADLTGEAQRLFEAYGGLGRGTRPQRADSDWFWAFRQAVPTWDLGATANAAFRASIFSNPSIGLLDEALGAGTPTGCSEDTYLFYKVLRAGYVVRYEPRAFVWHHHRTDMRALRRQIYSYAKGQVAYQLTTLFRDGDLRALARLFIGLPYLYWSRARDRWRGESAYPVSLIAIEVLGSLSGPFALWRSRRRARRLQRAEDSGHVVSSESQVLQERAS